MTVFKQILALLLEIKQFDPEFDLYDLSNEVKVIFNNLFWLSLVIL